ncbi:hypothetical protein DFA_12187 [Cavenderia fasciculata]|uniref:Uncharacterized protein n=1 Tax=Cavenderia fasciculata TaxID=261658 RepID=F4QCI7_CACFS|nr:uncharacterized protein DFA_12187 [Cavenderia fasciculata]EGG14415.1 hypothetical protein DFA_12187 [Cavenderia fasciculata]|eukprot:XP_004353824.1 hypothetical protein DFA_12187 [Cavenderia fasciculata]
MTEVAQRCILPLYGDKIWKRQISLYVSYPSLRRCCQDLYFLNELDHIKISVPFEQDPLFGICQEQHRRISLEQAINNTSTKVKQRHDGQEEDSEEEEEEEENDDQEEEYDDKEEEEQYYKENKQYTKKRSPTPPSPPMQKVLSKMQPKVIKTTNIIPPPSSSSPSSSFPTPPSLPLPLLVSKAIQLKEISSN